MLGFFFGVGGGGVEVSFIFHSKNYFVLLSISDNLELSNSSHKVRIPLRREGYKHTLPSFSTETQ